MYINSFVINKGLDGNGNHYSEKAIEGMEDLLAQSLFQVEGQILEYHEDKDGNKIIDKIRLDAISVVPRK